LSTLPSTEFQCAKIAKNEETAYCFRQIKSTEVETVAKVKVKIEVKVEVEKYLIS
jgi:hypothetical protein